jgi:hypothetical protein
VALFWQTPAAQTSLVHGFESSHSASARHAHVETCWQVPAEHVSTVQAMPSSQLISVPEHEPNEHASLVVQALLSLQERALFVYLQPVFLSQESVVQALLSLHETVV